MHRNLVRLMLPALLFAAGCASRVDLPEERIPPDGRSVSPYVEPQIRVASSRGEPGERVTLEVIGFPPLEDVVIGFGPPQSEYEVLTRLPSDAQGLVSTRMEVPAWATPGNVYVWVAATPDNQTRAISQGFEIVGDGDGASIEVEGVITDEGVECPALRSDDGTLYTLTGAPDWIAPGDSVQVSGTRAEVSFCQQGMTISVEEIVMVR